MPTLPSALAMDGENYLHPEGPQLDGSLFSVAPSNLEVCCGNLFAFVTRLVYIKVFHDCVFSVPRLVENNSLF